MGLRDRQLKQMIEELPPLNELAGYLRTEPELILAEAFRVPEQKAIIWPGPALDAELGTSLNQEVDNVRKQVLLAGCDAVTKLRDAVMQDVQLSEAESLGLELVHALTGRPALLVQDGAFVTPPPAWEGVLEAEREAVEARSIPPVGRIAFTIADDDEPQPCGTGFLVGERLIMTNRHVVEAFSHRESDGGWRLHPEQAALIDFRAESSLTARHEFQIEELVGVHPKVDTRSGARQRCPRSTIALQIKNLDLKSYRQVPFSMRSA